MSSSFEEHANHPAQFSDEHSNTLGNFVSSYKRSQSFSGLNFEALSDTRVPDETAIIEEDPNETTGLLRLPTNTSRRGSIISSFTTITGNSTLPQTIFNSINVLVGIALLSLPYGLRKSGLIPGLILLSGCFYATMGTANILGEILKRKPHLVTYGDIAGQALGPKFELLTTVFFTFDILGALVSLALLFSSAFASLFPVSENFLKVLIHVVMFCLTFVPLSYLSVISFAGIVGVFTTVILILICGFITTEQPGSLINPMSVNLFPKNLWNLALGLGIFMAPWGGHPVFPALYRDMKHTYKFTRSCYFSFSFTVFIDAAISIFGFFMFGHECEDMLLRNLLNGPHYPQAIKSIFLIIIGILPLLKMPLLAKPIVTTYENYLNINKEKMTPVDQAIKIGTRLIFVVIIMTISLMVQSFGKVIAFFGSSVCFALCMVFPYIFKLTILKDELSKKDIVLLYFGIALGVAGAIFGTLATFFAQ